MRNTHTLIFLTRTLAYLFHTNHNVGDGLLQGISTSKMPEEHCQERKMEHAHKNNKTKYETVKV